MRTLGIHTNYIRITSTEPAMKAAEEITEHSYAYEGDCMVVYIGVEKDDERAPNIVAAKLAADTLKRAETLKANKVIIYPYVHLTNDPSNPRTALSVLKKTAELLADKLDVFRAPFGWYKGFEISAKGHPLSEWSGVFTADEAEAKEEEKKAEKAPREKFSQFLALDLDGNIYEITPEIYSKCKIFDKKEPVYKLLKRFIGNELGRGVDTGSQPKHIEYMQHQELVDYCEVSEKGHFKWYPKGLFIQKLILDYAGRLAHEWGAMEMKNPIIIKSDNNIVGELMGEFHERDYKVDGGRGTCYLRYASDPLGFPFMQNVRFSRKQSPLKVYEEATCFRNEQEGEVSGLKRVRNFMMTDMHAACADVEEAREEYALLCRKFRDLMNDIIAGDRWVLGWEGTVEFFNENKEWLIALCKEMKVPSFFKLMPQMTHYYALKNEFQSITEDESNIQVSTVQWDVKDGERFNIGYTDEEGKKRPSAVILHASSFGSIERTLCAILENIAIDIKQGRPGMFPVWLAPTQVRVAPVKDEYIEFGEQLCRKFADANIRADLDDRTDTVGKKIRNAEKEWIPYILVVGEKEAASDELMVRLRKTREQQAMTFDALVAHIRAETAGTPYRPLPLPMRVSKRPIFFG
ncbi:MAG: threonine--tRNA ligase [bacterium]